MSEITALAAREILDSRGRPTVKATVTLADGVCASASVPAGASTGAAEARERRDGDPARYRGLGCLQAVANICGPFAGALVGRNWDQATLDAAMVALDGTPDKGRLGANALLAVSLSFARAVARERSVSLWRHFADLTGTAPRLPRLTINLFSGGKHAGGQVAIQDVLMVPQAASIDAALVMAFAVYQAAVERTGRRFGSRPLTADEGGLAPPFTSSEEMIAEAAASVEDAGLALGRDILLAIDVAATHFYQDGRYHLDGEALPSEQMITRMAEWAGRWPLASIEDGLAEDDWAHWPTLRAALAERGVPTLGDDLLCTNPARIERAITTSAADALLLKVNQIGTLTEAASALRLARDAGWHVTISARSGETEDDWLADLAVGWAGDDIKVGSITQSERLAKYNRLLEIEEELRLP
jgi:enolase